MGRSRWAGGRGAGASRATGGGRRSAGTATPLALALALAALLAGCGERTRAPGRAEGTRRMSARLEEIARTADPASNPYLNEARVAALRRLPAPTDPPDRVRRGAALARELLRAGRYLEAAEHFRLALEAADRAGLSPRSGLRRELRELLAAAHLRAGLQASCLEPGGNERCVMPPAGPGGAPPGAESVATGAPATGAQGPGGPTAELRAAKEAYLALVGEHPDDLRSRWLLNLAYMQLGLWPGGVPPRWLIPPSAFAPEYGLARFPDAAAAAGVDVVGRAGGSVLEDFDADGDLDLMASSMGLRDQLRYYRNEGGGRFLERTREAGLEGLVGGLNLVQADYDNDGHVDVFVLRGAWLPPGQPSSLLRNNGDGTFTDVTEEAGVLFFAPTQTAAWGDFDNDGWLDLFVGLESRPAFGTFPCRLYRNNGDGTFTDVAAEVGLAVVGFVKGAAWGDYDNDGLPDLYISRLGETNLLFHNDGPGGRGWRFTEVGRRAGVAEPLWSFPTWFWDYDNDGWLDLFVASHRGEIADLAAEALGLPHGGETPRLYRNLGDGTFRDVTREVGLDRFLLAMGANFGDLDSDGYPDLLVGTGDPDPRQLMPNRAFRNAGGRRFQDVTGAGGFGQLGKGHGVAFGDVDGDGDQDIYIVLGGVFEGDVSRNALLVNPGSGNDWITLRLEGVRSNRAAIGARIRVTVEEEGGGSRDVHAVVGSGGSFGANSLQQEIGLGRARRIRSLEVRWPGSGRVDVHPDVPKNRIVKIREGGSAVVLPGAVPRPGPGPPSRR